MSEATKWDADPGKQAEFLEQFRAASAGELAAIRARLLWLLVPTFFMVLVVLGLSVLTWMKVNDIYQEEGTRMRNIQRTLDELRRPVTTPETGTANKNDPMPPG